MNANITNRISSFERLPTTLDMDAPNTFLILISLVRFKITNAARLNKPRHAMEIANPPTMAITVPACSSDLYASLKCSSRNCRSGVLSLEIVFSALPTSFNVRNISAVDTLIYN